RDHEHGVVSRVARPPRDDVLHRRARRVRVAREALLGRGVVAEGAEAGDETVADAVVLRAADRMRHVADDLAVERQRALGGKLARGRRGRLRRGAAEPRQGQREDRADDEEEESGSAARHRRIVAGRRNLRRPSPYRDAMTRRLIFLAIVFAAATAGAATLDQTFDRTYDVRPGARLVLDNVNGRVT